ncbi:hypothetical protein BDQ12DRAFT_660872 [Crucibulum laeve]|uniref:Uncharacterized protein n=1 Tax=Crucibulum laeve TaxID=68775 RepID=A0A5C3MRU9_9AGAR|nr:hypothetical protein BDQ12DRAFT_660872 [Crucibulum laeve]
MIFLANEFHPSKDNRSRLAEFLHRCCKLPSAEQILGDAYREIEQSITALEHYGGQINDIDFKRLVIAFSDLIKDWPNEYNQRHISVARAKELSENAIRLSMSVKLMVNKTRIDALLNQFETTSHVLSEKTYVPDPFSDPFRDPFRDPFGDQYRDSLKPEVLHAELEKSWVAAPTPVPVPPHQIVSSARIDIKAAVAVVKTGPVKWGEDIEGEIRGLMQLLPRGYSGGQNIVAPFDNSWASMKPREYESVEVKCNSAPV